jgi:hypothetical protein
MTLFGMESDVTSYIKEWKNSTSQHVKSFWLGFGELSPFYIGRVVTTLIDEKRVLLPQSENLSFELVNTTPVAGRPDPLQIIYSQDIYYLERPDRGDLGYENFMESDLFTLPFELDGGTYTNDLRFISNNTQIIFMDYTGVVLAPPPTPSDTRARNVLIIVVTVVALSLLLASGYIFYLTRIKEHDSAVTTGTVGGGMDGESHMVGAIIGVNASDNILISESYDDDFFDSAHPNGAMRPEALPLQEPQVNPSSEGDLNPGIPVDDTGPREFEPPFENVRGHHLGTDAGLYPTISTVPLTNSDVESDEMPGNYFSYSPMPSFRTSSMGSQNDPDYSPPSPLMGGHGNEYGDTEEAKNVDEDDTDEPNIPFMSGFQLEIQDLE